jgi:transcriptional regulator with XRE-family HTH domain
MDIEYYGDSLKQKRLARFLSQEELAYNLGVRVQSISNWETNRRKPSLKHLQALQALLEEKREESNS